MAILTICSCRKHGYITADDGFRGPEFGSKDHLRYVIGETVSLEICSLQDGDILFLAAETSPLPETVDDADINLLWKIECINQLRCDASPEVDLLPADMCEQLSMPAPTPMPSDFIAVMKQRMDSRNQ